VADLTDSETILEPDDSIKAASPSEAGTSSTPEISQRILDVRAPHESIHTRKKLRHPLRHRQRRSAHRRRPRATGEVLYRHHEFRAARINHV
jgi:hypothetical protein